MIISEFMKKIIKLLSFYYLKEKRKGCGYIKLNIKLIKIFFKNYVF